MRAQLQRNVACRSIDLAQECQILTCSQTDAGARIGQDALARVEHQIPESRPERLEPVAANDSEVGLR